MSDTNVQEKHAKRDSSDGDEGSVKLGTNDVVPHNHLELENNDDGQVRNPLYGIPRGKLFADVDQFAAENGLSADAELLKRGALVAQNPVRFNNIDDLSAEEKDALEHERLHKWSHPMTLYLTIVVCSIGAACQGWDQTGSNGANLSFSDAFGLPESGPNGRQNTFIIGTINAAPYIASAVVGTWLSDPFNKYFGRRGCIFITGLILVITPICSGLVQTWPQLFIVRFLLGIGMGAKGSTVPVFAAENSPSTIRGALVMSWQLWTAFGIFIGTAANVVVKDTGDIAWRLQLGSAFIPAVPLVALIYLCPESPRWLMRKGRYADALKSLRRLRHSDIQAARDLISIHAFLKEEASLMNDSSFFSRFGALFTIPRVRRATMASGVVMLAQQMCGINIIAFYSSTIFFKATQDVNKSLYASLGFGALNFVGAFPAIFTIDTFGRRALLLTTFPIMAVMLLAAGLAFLAPHQGDGAYSPSGLGPIALFIYIFTLAYSIGEGPVPFTYSAEVFPLQNREVGMAWAVTVCLGFAAVLSITFPALLEALTATGAFCFYAGLNAIAFVMIFFLLPETKQLTLEQLDQVFSIPTGRFASYQVKKALPYFFKRYVFWQKNATLEPLVKLDDSLIEKEQRSAA